MARKRFPAASPPGAGRRGDPQAGLIDVNGTMCGTALGGGNGCSGNGCGTTSRGGGTKCAFYGGYHLGCGTVFALTP
ncbi:MAG: hypothetical protein WBE30_03935 [Candidatus Cybelea sp.]